MSDNPDDRRHMVKINDQDGEKIAAFVDRQQRFEDELRRANRDMLAAQKAKDPRKQREACIIALLAVWALLKNDDHVRRENLHRIFRIMTAALHDFNKGEIAELLVHNSEHRKLRTDSSRVFIATSAAACIQILIEEGMPKKNLYKVVAGIFADAGHITPKKNGVTDRTLKEWSDKKLAPESLVAGRVEIMRKRISDSIQGDVSPQERLSKVLKLVKDIARTANL